MFDIQRFTEVSAYVWDSTNSIWNSEAISDFESFFGLCLTNVTSVTGDDSEITITCEDITAVRGKGLGNINIIYNNENYHGEIVEDDVYSLVVTESQTYTTGQTYTTVSPTYSTVSDSSTYTTASQTYTTETQTYTTDSSTYTTTNPTYTTNTPTYTSQTYTTGTTYTTQTYTTASETNEESVINLSELTVSDIEGYTDSQIYDIVSDEDNDLQDITKPVLKEVLLRANQSELSSLNELTINILYDYVTKVQDGTFESDTVMFNSVYSINEEGYFITGQIIKTGISEVVYLVNYGDSVTTYTSDITFIESSINQSVVSSILSLMADIKSQMEEELEDTLVLDTTASLYQCVDEDDEENCLVGSYYQNGSIYTGWGKNDNATKEGIESNIVSTEVLTSYEDETALSNTLYQKTLVEVNHIKYPRVDIYDTIDVVYNEESMSTDNVKFITSAYLGSLKEAHANKVKTVISFVGTTSTMTSVLELTGTKSQIVSDLNSRNMKIEYLQVENVLAVTYSNVVKGLLGNSSTFEVTVDSGLNTFENEAFYVIGYDDNGDYTLLNASAHVNGILNITFDKAYNSIILIREVGEFLASEYIDANEVCLLLKSEYQKGTSNYSVGSIALRTSMNELHYTTEYGLPNSITRWTRKYEDITDIQDSISSTIVPKMNTEIVSGKANMVGNESSLYEYKKTFLLVQTVLKNKVYYIRSTFKDNTIVTEWDRWDKNNLLPIANAVSATLSNKYSNETVSEVTEANCANALLTKILEVVSFITNNSTMIVYVDGLLSGQDKYKLDHIEAEANKYVLPPATSAVLGGVIPGINMVVSNGSLSVQDSPSFTGTPTTTQPDSSDSTLRIATTRFVHEAIASLVSNSPQALDTLNELAQALNNDPNFATTVSNQIGQKLNSSGGTITGNLTVEGTLDSELASFTIS